MAPRKRTQKQPVASRRTTKGKAASGSHSQSSSLTPPPESDLDTTPHQPQLASPSPRRPSSPPRQQSPAQVYKQLKQRHRSHSPTSGENISTSPRRRSPLRPLTPSPVSQIPVLDRHADQRRQRNVTSSSSSTQENLLPGVQHSAASAARRNRGLSRFPEPVAALLQDAVPLARWAAIAEIPMASHGVLYAKVGEWWQSTAAEHPLENVRNLASRRPDRTEKAYVSISPALVLHFC
jgi:hypothetical protein